MLDLVVYLSLNKCCCLPFNITVNSGTHGSICLCFFLMFHMKTTTTLIFTCVSSL
uniref:Uncharacterized protein n=1 Tax=Ailuropoda melanoleuca TaxID=9646 RepID=A0A7N5KF89_AILME